MASSRNSSTATGSTFPQISDDAADVHRRFGVAAQPALAMVGPDGDVQTLFGAADEELVDSPTRTRPTPDGSASAAATQA